MDYWVEKGRFSVEDLHNIDWYNQEKAMKLMSLTKRRFISKWVSNYVATGKNMKRWEMRPHGYCPFFKQEDEDTQHILNCMHHDAQNVSKQALWKLVETLVKIGTCTMAVRAIRNKIEAWRNNTAHPNINHLPDDLATVIKAQRQIGWKSFLEGLFSIQWKQYQQAYFQEANSRRSADLWVSKAIRAGWTYIFTIWQERNEQLHRTDRIKDLAGRKEIIKAIKAEYRLGLGRLPAYGFSYMFKKKEEKLIQSDMETMIHWLATIKQGRIVYEDPNRIQDEFYSTGALYKTLDLQELHDDEYDMDM